MTKHNACGVSSERAFVSLLLCVYFVIMTELRESVKHTCVVGM